MRRAFFLTSAACVSAQVYPEELRVVVEPEVIVRRVRGDVVLGHQSDVKVEPSVFLVDDVKHLLQTQPMFSCTGEHAEQRELSLRSDSSVKGQIQIISGLISVLVPATGPVLRGCLRLWLLDSVCDGFFTFGGYEAVSDRNKPAHLHSPTTSPAAPVQLLVNTNI